MFNLRALAIQPQTTINEAYLPKTQENRHRLILDGLQGVIETNVKGWLLGGMTEDQVNRSYSFMVLAADRMLTENRMNPNEVRAFLTEQKLNE